jgi:hypothetical protein
MKKFKFFSPADYEKLEVWLREQRKNGLALQSAMVPGIFTFEKCEGENVIYKVEFLLKNTDEIKNYYELYENNGWKFICKNPFFNFFVRPANSPETGEPIATNEIRVEMLSNVLFNRLGIIDVLLLAIIVALSRPFFEGNNLNVPLFSLVCAVFIILMCYTICAAVGYHKLRNKYPEVKKNGFWRK